MLEIVQNYSELFQVQPNCFDVLNRTETDKNTSCPSQSWTKRYQQEQKQEKKAMCETAVELAVKNTENFRISGGFEH